MEFAFEGSRKPEAIPRQGGDTEMDSTIKTKAISGYAWMSRERSGMVKSK
jgi:hypothetical protein